MLLVAAAALSAVGAGVLLILGWSTNDATLVWVSILASGFAALFLVAAARVAAAEEPDPPEGS